MDPKGYLSFLFIEIRGLWHQFGGGGGGFFFYFILKFTNFDMFIFILLPMA